MERIHSCAPAAWTILALLLACALPGAAVSAAGQTVRESFATDPLPDGRFVQRTANTQSSFAFDGVRQRLTAVLDVDANSAFYLSEAFNPLTDAADSSFSARFRVENFDDVNHPTAFAGLLTEQHVGDYGDGLVMVISLAGGALVAHADVESFEQNFTGSAIPLELGADYAVVGRFRSASRQFAIEIFNGPGFTNLVGFSTAVLPPGHALTLNRLGLQNGGARDLDSAAGFITLSVDDLYAPADSARRISIGDATVSEGHDGTTNAVFNVELSLPSSLPISVNFSTVNGTATAGQDYTAQSGTVVFPPGVTSVPVTIAVLGDLLPEGVEDFFVNLDGAVDATILNESAFGTILDDDPRPLLSITDAAILEGDSGTTDMEFVVSFAAPSGQPVSVAYATTGGTATAGTDYVARSGTLSFAPGETSQRITIQVRGDEQLEGDETFYLQLSNATGAGLLKSQGTGTIFDDDAARRLSIDEVALPEGNTGTTAFVFPVTLTRASATPVTVDYAVASGTAIVGEDLLHGSGTLTFQPGVTRATITVSVAGDTAPESDETFTVNLSNPQNASIAKASGLGTIRNDDPFPELSIADADVVEGDSGTSAALFPVRLSFALDRPVTASYSTADGTAAAPGDYLRQSGTVTFQAGSTVQNISIPVAGDLLNEPNETFSLSLSNSTVATISRGRAVVTIIDNDPAPTISVEDVLVFEGDAGSANAVFTIKLSAAAGQSARVSYTTVDGAAAAGSDYVAKFGTVTLPPGSTTAQVSVAVNGDTRFEPDEQFLLRLENPINATLLTNTARCTIRNDDPMPTISISDAGVTEVAGGTEAIFQVSLSEPSLEAVVTVNYATADGTATEGTDYGDASGVISFMPGETEAAIKVAILDDLLPEADETFYVELAGSSNGEIANDQARGIIRDNDVLPRMFLRDAQAIEGDVGTSQLVFNLELDSPSGSPVTAAFTARDGTAVAASGDYAAASGQVRFEPGQTNTTLAIAVQGDLAIEPDETLVLDLNQLVNAVEGRVHAIGTILDDDTRKLVISDAAVTEGAHGTSTNATVRITLNKPSTETVTVRVATSDGSATAGADYLAANVVVTFPPGVLSRDVSVTVLGDDVFEPDETFMVNMTEAAHAVVADAQGIVTILNDDDSLAIVPAGMSLVTEDCTPNNGAIDPGEIVTVRFALRNIGTLPSSVVVARLLAGPGITPINAAQTYGLLPPNSDPVDRTFTFRADGECGESLQAVLQIENGGIEYGPAIFSFPLGLRVDGNPVCCYSADIGVTASPAPTPDPIVVNHDLTYTLIVTNRGPRTATQLKMTNSWRAPVIIRSAQSSQGSCTNQGETVLCDLGSLEPGASATVEIVVAPQELPGLIGVFSANAAEHEPNPADNRAIVSTTVIPPAGLSIGNIHVKENRDGTNAVFTVRLSQPTGLPVTADYSTADGSARAGEDYAASTGVVTIPARAASATITIPIINDDQIEADETFSVTLRNASNATLATEQTVGTATIVDDDVPVLIVDDATMLEPGPGSRATLVFVARLSVEPLSVVTTDFVTSDGTASAPSDYTAASGRITFAPGVTTARIEVEVAGDQIAEGEETFFLDLSNPAGVQLARSRAKGTIIDDTSLPELSISGVSVLEGASRSSTEAVFSVRLSRPSAQVVEADYATANGSALGGSDFVIGAGKIRIASGETNAVVRVTVNGDDVAEHNETFFVRLGNPVRSIVGTGEAQGTIINDDYLPLLHAGGTQLRLENCPPANLAIDPMETVTVDFGLLNRGLSATTNLTATLRASEHIEPLSNPQTYGVLTTNGPATFRPFTFSIDGVCGMSYTAELELRDNGRLAGVVSFEFPLGAVVNGEFSCCTSADLAAGVESGPNPVELFRPLTYVITITNKGPAIATGILLTNRFSAPVQLLSASLGQWNCTFTNNQLVCGVGDLFPGESVRVTNVVAPTELPSLVNHVLVGGAEADGFEGDNRAIAATMVVPASGISIGNSTFVEGDEDRSVEVLVRLSPGRSQTVTVSYELADGTARAGEDYVAAAGVVTFPPGTTTASVPLVIRGDLRDELDETITIILRNAVNAPIARAEGVCTIADDDDPALSISNASVNVGTNTAVYALVTVTLSSASTETIRVDYSTSNGSATAGTDYEPRQDTLTFVPGTTTMVASIPLSGNTADEGEEHFFVWLTNAVNSSLPDLPGVVTITDEAPADLVISNSSAVEGDSGQTEALFTVTLRNRLEHTATVDFFTSDDTALAGEDYAATQGTLRFPPGIMEQTVTVAILGDLIAEPAERFHVNLTNAVNGVIRNARGVGTITDNDPEPCISIGDLTVSEGNSGTNIVMMPLRLSSPSSGTVRVDGLLPGCASSASGAGASQHVVFAPGQIEAALMIPIVGDLVDEPDEICLVLLTNAVGATICRGEAQLIVNDDDPPPGLEISDASIMEGNSGGANATFVVTLAGLTSRAVTVQFTTRDGTATRDSDYNANSGTLTFPPGSNSAAISVLVLGDDVVEPDETFDVVLSQPLNAALFKSVGAGTIRNDDSASQTECPAIVVVGTPGDQICFEPFAPITLIATPDEASEKILRMEFYSGSTLVGVDTSSPFEITWEGAPVGDYCVTAQAVCASGATVQSEPACIAVTDRGAAIAIIRNFDDPEIDRLREYLLEMGYCARVFDQEGLTFESLSSHWLIIWDDLGSAGLTSSTAQVLGEIFDAGIPLYLIGDRLGSAAASLTPDARSTWSYLLRMTHSGSAAVPGLIAFSTATENRQPGSILNGRFANVTDFTYTNAVDRLTLDFDATSIASANGADLLVHYPPVDVTDFGQTRGASQGFRVTGGGDSLLPRKELFQNTVCWLMRCSFCPLVYLGVRHSDVPETVNVGDEFTFTVTVGNNGECIGFGAILTNQLPAGVSLVSFNYSQGAGVEYNAQNRTLTWRVGSVVSGSENNALLSLTVKALQPGVFRNVACATANYELFDESNCDEFELRIEGTAIPEPPSLSFIRTGQDLLELRLSGQPGSSYQIQASSDLLHWLQWTNAVGPLFYIEIPTPALSGSPMRFYRAR